MIVPHDYYGPGDGQVALPNKRTWDDPAVQKELKQQTIRFHDERDFQIWLTGCLQLQLAGQASTDLAELERRSAEARLAIQQHERTLEETKVLAQEAQQTLALALEAVSGFEQQVELDQTRVELASIHRLSASVCNQLNDFRSALSEVGAASRTLTLDLRNIPSGKPISRALVFDETSGAN